MIRSLETCDNLELIDQFIICTEPAIYILNLNMLSYIVIATVFLALVPALLFRANLRAYAPLSSPTAGQELPPISAYPCGMRRDLLERPYEPPSETSESSLRWLFWMTIPKTALQRLSSTS